MKRFAVWMVLCCVSLAVAGQLDPSSAPAPTMKTLDEVEPRIPIHQSDIPLTISEPGSYYLAENVTYSGGSGCIVVSADNVTIDLGGFTMTGTYPAYYGIYMASRNNVEIRNGTVEQFFSGIIDAGVNGQNHRVFDVRVRGCETHGIFLQSSENCQIRDCTISDCGTTVDASGSCYGILVGKNSVISQNTVYRNGVGTTLRPYGICTGNGCTVTGNTVYENGMHTTADYAIGILVGYSCTVSGNTVYDNLYSTNSDYAYGIYAGNGSVVTENAVYDNGNESDGDVYGIYAGGGCTLSKNTIRANGTLSTGNKVYGIFAFNGCTLSGNTSYDNGDSANGTVYGIYAGLGGTIRGNSAYSNGTSSSGTSVTGIYAGAGSVVTDNAARSNGGSASGVVTGIYLGGYNLVNNNAAYSNSGTGGGTNISASATSTFGINCAP